MRSADAVRFTVVTPPPKSERLAELFRRLAAAPPASSAAEAKSLLDSTLNSVEDDLTAIPFDRSAWQNDGRMYPPQEDSRRPVPGRPDVARYRSRSHNTYIGANGAIEIALDTTETLFKKAGRDGRHIWQ